MTNDEATVSASRSAMLTRLRMEVDFERGVGSILQWLLMLVTMLVYLLSSSKLETAYAARSSLMRTMKLRNPPGCNFLGRG